MEKNGQVERGNTPKLVPQGKTDDPAKLNEDLTKQASDKAKDGLTREK